MLCSSHDTHPHHCSLRLPGLRKDHASRRWRREESLRDAAVIVHDLSDFGLDAELLAGEDAAPRQGLLTGRVAVLHGSHARGKLHASAGRALAEIAALQPPLVFAESTGAARPWPLIRALTQDDRFSLRHFIVTVDALNLHRDFADGAALAANGPELPDPALHQAAAVLAEQIVFASIIVLTKTDTIPAATVKTQVAHLQQLQPRAAVALSAQAGLLHHQLEGVPAPSLADLQRRADALGLTDRDTATASAVDCLIFRERLAHSIRSGCTMPVATIWVPDSTAPKATSGSPRVPPTSCSGSRPAARFLGNSPASGAPNSSITARASSFQKRSPTSARCWRKNIPTSATGTPNSPSSGCLTPAKPSPQPSAGPFAPMTKSPYGRRARSFPTHGRQRCGRCEPDKNQSKGTRPPDGIRWPAAVRILRGSGTQNSGGCHETSDPGRSDGRNSPCPGR